jgi:hypothetical protein
LCTTSSSRSESAPLGGALLEPLADAPLVLAHEDPAELRQPVRRSVDGSAALECRRSGRPAPRSRPVRSSCPTRADAPRP